MQSSQVPPKFSVPFANAAGGGFIRTVPAASQIGIQDGAASFADGFPPLNFTPVASGGVPPFGADMNGIINPISAWARWQAAGGSVVYDSAFSTAVGGYPKNAILASTTAGRFWMSTIENNTNNPDTTPTGWRLMPGAFPQSHAVLSATTTLAASTSGTYYTVSGSAPVITLPSAAAADGQPWGFYATVTCTVVTAAGTFLGGNKSGLATIALVNGQWLCVQSDGTNWTIFSAHPAVVQDAAIAGTTGGRLLAIRTLTGAGTYTPTAGTNSIEGVISGPGGGGAGCVGSNVRDHTASGPGGGSGATSWFYLVSGFAGLSYVVGPGGVGGAAGDNVGSNGGNSSFGSIVAPGGPGGPLGATNDGTTMPFINTADAVAAGAGGYLNVPGNAAPSGHVWGLGAAGFWGGGGEVAPPAMSAAGPGGNGRAPGAGGAGGHVAQGNSGVGPQAGGNGANGTIILREYS